MIIVLGFFTGLFLYGIYKNYTSEERGTFFTKYKPKYKLSFFGYFFIVCLIILYAIFGGILWW
jgi:hypothetical protein